MEYETVYRIWDYFDQPRSGVADYRGRAHWFDCIFDQSRDIYSNTYLLTPLDERLRELERQRWDAFERSRDATEKDTPHTDTRAAFERLQADFQKAIASSSHRLKLRGDFRLLNPPVRSVQSAAFQVSWTDPEE